MATILEALKGINAYPIPLRTLDEIAQRRDIELTDEASQDALKGKAYNLARADLLLWLSYAPNVSQGGQSYSFTDEQRTDLRNAARAIYAEFEEEELEAKTNYGYKGSRL